MKSSGVNTVSEINAALGIEGAGVPLVVEDRTYYAMPLTKASQGKLEAWLEGRTWAALARTQRILPSDQWANVAARTNEKIACGEYSFKSLNMAKALQTEDGARMFLKLMLEPKQPNVKEEDLDFIFERVSPSDIEAMLHSVYPKLKPSQEGTT